MSNASFLISLIVIFFTFFNGTDAFAPLFSRQIMTTRSHHRLMSTVISPPRVDKTTKRGTEVEPSIPDFLFKENRDVQKEFEEYIDENKFYVILYNDPFNKFIYVQQALMEVMSMAETVAQDTMMQAHTYGFAVAGEWIKEVAEDYAEKLVEKGLVAEAKSSKQPESAGDSQ